MINKLIIRLINYNKNENIKVFETLETKASYIDEEDDNLIMFTFENLSYEESISIINLANYNFTHVQTIID